MFSVKIRSWIYLTDANYLTEMIGKSFMMEREMGEMIGKKLF
jgi:hypothetical protein